MKIVDLNPFGGIGANSHFVEIGPFRLLVDSGLNPEKVGLEAMPDFRLLPKKALDLIILTHCHLDHLGTLPVVFRKNPQAKVLLSAASALLAPRMLSNSHNVMLRQRDSLGVQAYPLYNQKDIKAVKSAFHIMPFDKPLEVKGYGDSLKVTFYHAGHVAGAASVKLEYRHRTIFFTGDVLFAPQYTLEGAKLPRDPVDTLVMETTRGGKGREVGASRSEEIQRLWASLRNTLSRGGAALIPCFALGRTQEILSLLYHGLESGYLPKVPIFCSGLGLDLVDYFDRISSKGEHVTFRRKILQHLGVRILSPKQLKQAGNVQPGIYVLSSGMLVEETPSYRIAARMLGQPKNGIFFVGYCDPLTPGGKLLQTPVGQSFVFETLNVSADVLAQVEQFDLSGHADREELLDFATALAPRSIVLTHGEPKARQWFQEALPKVLPSAQILDPIPLDAYTV